MQHLSSTLTFHYQNQSVSVIPWNKRERVNRQISLLPWKLSINESITQKYRKVSFIFINQFQSPILHSCCSMKIYQAAKWLLIGWKEAEWLGGCRSAVGWSRWSLLIIRPKGFEASRTLHRRVTRRPDTERGKTRRRRRRRRGRRGRKEERGRERPKKKRSRLHAARFLPGGSRG